MHVRVLILLGLCIFCTQLFAEESQWKQCSSQGKKKSVNDDPTSEEQISDDDERVHLFRLDQDVHADQVQYSTKERKAIATGNVLLRDPDLEITSERIDYWVDSETAKASDVRYWYFPSHGSGTADSVERVSKEVVKLENTTYSTCDFEDRDWEMKAEKVTLDREKSVGTARNVTAKFKGVPFFYTPWINFPLDNERKTGFLAPVFGRSSNSGLSLATPFYWNIAPNRDALITPRWLSKRGMQFNGGARYLNPTNFGEVNLQFLDDNEADGENRYLIALEHEQRFNKQLRTELLYNKVSDDQYFEDLADTLGLSSTQRLERRGDLRYRNSHFGGTWNGILRLQQFQIVDDTRPSFDDPYKRLPQFVIGNSFRNLPVGLEFTSRSEWVAFEHDDRLDGKRLNLGVELSRPWKTPGYFIEPSARLMHTSYSLSDTDPGVNDDPSRTLPSFSLDSGLILERELSDRKVRQTLEPRLFYLFTPDRNHDDIPLFDTGEYEFSFSQLFRKDRFTGADRVADANQLTAALSTRILEQHSGRELFRASIGQIFYFEDLDVTLNNTEAVEDNTSNIAAELLIGFSDRWEAVASALYDPQEDQYNRSSFRFQYQTPRNFVFNIGHRFRRADFSQSDISFIYPISNQWRAVGRWAYDFRDDRDLAILGGLEYDTCCWKLRFAARRFTNDSEGDYNNSIEIQLTLKGLTSLGSPLVEQLERSIRGYEDRNTYVY